MSGVRMSRDRFLERRTTRRADDSDAMGHRWVDEGQLETGDPAVRCSGCHAMRHWPIASQPCLPVRLSGVRAKAAARKAAGEQHPPNRTCARAECGERYFSSHPRSMYCSQRCAFLCHRRQQTAAQKRFDVRAREASARAPETREQKDARLARQRDARRAETALRRERREAAKTPEERTRTEANRRNYQARKARWEAELATGSDRAQAAE